MVVGDRLWLFSQTPSAANHPQSMIANNSMALRGYGANQPLPSSNCSSSTSAASTALPPQIPPIFGNHLPSANYLNQEHTMSGYDFNKSETFYRQFLTTQQSKYGSAILPNKFTKDYRNPSDNNYLSANHHSKTLINKLFWSNEFANKPTMDTNYEKLRFPYDAFINGYNGEQSNTVDQNINAINTDIAATSEISGIAELERVFGSNDKCGQSFNSDTKFNKKLENKQNNGAQDNSDCFSEDSDVDCERL